MCKPCTEPEWRQEPCPDCDGQGYKWVRSGFGWDVSSRCLTCNSMNGKVVVCGKCGRDFNEHSEEVQGDQRFWLSSKKRSKT